MGGIQSIDALHGDPLSSPFKKNPFDVASLTGFEVNLKFLQTRIFGSHTAITTVWEAFSFGEAIRDPEQTTHNTPEVARSSYNKQQKVFGGSRKHDLHFRASPESSDPSRFLFIEFWGLKRTCAREFWVTVEEQKKRRQNS